MNQIEVFPLSEGVFTIGHDRIFHSFNFKKDQLNERPIGSLLVEIQPFLVRAKGKNILLDTGLGFKLENGSLQIHENLKKYGLEPNDIHYVILSHLHKDHAGGIRSINVLGVEQLNFPNAIYFVNQNEFEYAMKKGAPSYIVEDFEILKNSTQTEWLGHNGKISDFIFFEEVGGHCPHHCVIRIEVGDEKIFFGGDVAPQLKQLKMKYVAKYDYDGKRSMELRSEFSQKGKMEAWQFLFYHDVKNPISKL